MSRFLENVHIHHHNFINDSAYAGFQAAYMIDVFEHIAPSRFLDNVIKLLRPQDGVLIIGVPNKASEAYASEASRRLHINMHTHDSLKTLMETRFKNVFMFGMNDEVVHTGYSEMCHYLWAVCAGPK
jgi:2-polyprenyl-3-methyl-5-hydroxy-6-metoxy-1,4-benzoquinol methylase